MYGSPEAFAIAQATLCFKPHEFDNALEGAARREALQDRRSGYQNRNETRRKKVTCKFWASSKKCPWPSCRFAHFCPVCDGQQDHRESNCPKRGDDKWKALAKLARPVARQPQAKTDCGSVLCGGTSAGPAPSFAKSVSWAQPLTTFSRTLSPTAPTSEIMLLESSTASPVAKFKAEEALGAFVDPLIAPKLSPSGSVGVTLSSSSSTHFQNPEWVLSVQRLSLRLAKISLGDEMWHEFPFMACALPFAFAAAHQLSLANQCQKGGVVLLVSYFGIVESLVLEPWATHVWFNQLSSPGVKSGQDRGIMLADFRWTRGIGRKIVFIPCQGSKLRFSLPKRRVLPMVPFAIQPFRCKFNVMAILRRHGYAEICPKGK
eukprot:g19417.t1